MSYVQQVCEGFSKKTLLGNWYQQRLYPPQPFREEQKKEARGKEEGITCFDNTGFQRALPRLERRSKWETGGRIVLNDGIISQTSVMRAQYPHGQQQSAMQMTGKPFDRNAVNVQSTSVHPHSEYKVVQKAYKMVTPEALNQLPVQPKYETGLRSDLVQHLPYQEKTFFQTSHQSAFGAPLRLSEAQKTQDRLYKGSQYAGSFTQAGIQSVKPITTLVSELHKEEGADIKEQTSIQRTWVPPGDKAVSASLGRTADQFRQGTQLNNDIQTSLNIGTGLQNVHPKKCADGYFRHVRQDVTMQPNRTFSTKP